MFSNQTKVNGEYVKGLIIDGEYRTASLVHISTKKPITLDEIKEVVSELILLEKEMKNQLKGGEQI